MPGSVREQWQERAGTIAIAIVVTVLIAVGALIASRGGSSPSSAVPTTTSPPQALPVGASLRPAELLKGAASDFEGGTGDWIADAASLTLAAGGYQSSGSLSVAPAGGTSPTTAPTDTASPADGSDLDVPALTAWSPEQDASAGDRFVGNAYVKTASGDSIVQLEMRFIDAAGNVTDTEYGEPVRDTERWGQPPVVAAISPKGTTHVELGVSFPASTAASDQYVDQATLAETPGGHARVVGPLTTRGNQILDGNGQPLILRGMQRFGLEGGSKNPLPTEAEIAQLSMWGANEVRISLGEQLWLQTSCYYQADYPQEVDKVVNWVTSRGMVALINLHFSTAGDCRPPTLTPMADSPGSLTFWQEVATRYQSNPLVAFDLFNEPYVPQSIWLNGGAFTFDGHGVAAAGMQQLYDAVRNTGAKNLIVVSGLNYASEAPTAFVDGVNLAYGVHAYTCPQAPPPHCTKAYAADPYDPSPILDRWLPLAKDHPLIISEFGFPNGDNSVYNANLVGYATAHDLGWSAFAWDGGTDGLFDLVQSRPASDGTTIEPNAAGMPLVAAYALNWPAQP
ncbi:MAG TPA: glycoside hydrolase family 5 protein [Mycobacteriales bacterium]|nr:glycoside hydrolase family 5 protein [Mycobacteriales bacterium]